MTDIKPEKNPIVCVKIFPDNEENSLLKPEMVWLATDDIFIPKINTKLFVKSESALVKIWVFSAKNPGIVL